MKCFFSKEKKKKFSFGFIYFLPDEDKCKSKESISTFYIFIWLKKFQSPAEMTNAPNTLGFISAQTTSGFAWDAVRENKLFLYSTTSWERADNDFHFPFNSKLLLVICKTKRTVGRFGSWAVQILRDKTFMQQKRKKTKQKPPSENV